jgi:hypothetical protein
MRRAFGYEVLAYPRCGQAMRLVALIDHPQVIRRILRHLGEPLDVPAPAPARAPPRLDDADAPGSVHGTHRGDLAEGTPACEEPC